MATATQKNRTQETVTPDGEIVDAAIDATQSMEYQMMRLETEQAFTEARLRPRRAKEVIEQLREEIEAYPRIATSMIYSKPVGRDERGQMQYARALSIRAAESIAAALGCNRVRCVITMIDDMHCQIDAVYVDYAHNRFWSESTVVSRRYKARSGKIQVHPEDRFLDVVVKAEKSKVLREAILRATSSTIKIALEDLADEVIDSMLDEATVSKIVANFAGKGVNLETLESHCGQSRKDWTKNTRRTFVELWTAIEAEETTVQEVFGAPKKDEESRLAEASKGDVSAETLGSAKATQEPDKKAAINQEMPLTINDDQASELKQFAEGVFTNGVKDVQFKTWFSELGGDPEKGLGSLPADKLGTITEFLIRQEERNQEEG